MALHPAAEKLLKASKENKGQPITAVPIAQARKIMYNNFVNDRRILQEVGRIEDSHIPCLWGKMPIRIYEPRNFDGVGALLFFHGGGFCMNSIETHDELCRRITNATGRLIISIEYRLAPEYKCPTLMEDAVNAAQWCYDNYEKLGYQKSKLAIGGDSGGAYQSIITCLYFRDRGGIKLEKQILIYPPTDYVFPSTESMIRNDKNSVVNRDFSIWGWNNYLDHNSDLSSPYVIPMRAEYFGDLPSALVITAEYDPLLDEGENFVKRILDDGGYAVCKRFNGMMHGFIMVPQLFDEANEAVAEIAKFLNGGD